MLFKFNLLINVPRFLSTKHTIRRRLTTMTTTNSDLAKELIEKGKKTSAYMAIDENLNKDIKVMGIGSGSTIVYAVERLAERIKNENLDICCIPSSYQSKQLLVKYNIPVSDLETFTSIDLTIDGADEIDKDLTCIKGGGGCHLQEKLVAHCAKNFILIADSRKRSTKLGQNWQNGIPIEVLPLAHRLVQETIENLYGGKAILREYSGPGRGKAGPVVTDNGNFILDWKFETKDDNDNVNYDWKSINTSIKMIPGVIETGLFIGMAKMAYIGNLDGSVTKLIHK